MASSVQIIGLEETVRRLRALPKELSGKGGGPIRSALFQAAKLIREEAKQRVPVATGNLRDNIVTVRHRSPKTVGATERYDVGMRGGTRKLGNTTRNRRSGRVGAKVRTAGKIYYGRMVELGTSKMAARPFLRPAFESKKQEAVKLFADKLLRAVELAEQKLARGGR